MRFADGLVVRVMDAHACIASDLDELIYGREQSLARAADVACIDAVVFGDDAGKCREPAGAGTCPAGR
jgi:hypothetical protein